MKITKELIKNIAQLAKLEFDTKAEKRMQDDIKNILDFVDKLSEIDTKDVEPLTYLNEETNILRDDQIKEALSQKDALRNAPDKDSDYFKIPTIIKKLS